MNNERDAMRSILRAGGVALSALILTGCVQSAYDFPVATMVGQQRGYSMTGYVKSAEEATARPKILRRLEGVCPHGADIVDLKTTRADAAIGTKILRYEALVTCRDQ